MQDVEQLRRDLEEAVAGLSPDARRVWDEIEEDTERVAHGEEVAPELPPDYEGLLPSEKSALFRVVRLSQELYAALEAEHGGMAALMRQAEGVIRRAQELEPSIGENATLEEAVAALKRHGVNPGISPELAEMVVRVPAVEPTEEEVEAALRRALDDLSPSHRRVLNIRMKLRGENETPVEILEEVSELSEQEAREYLEEFRKLVEEVVDEVVADDLESRQEGEEE